MSSSHARPGAFLTLVAIVAALVDIGFALLIVGQSLLRGRHELTLALMVGGGLVGLTVLAAVAVEQSARGRGWLAWPLVIPPVLAAYAVFQF